MGVIFLNGCTSAGKSSIAKALQAILDPPHLRFGIDDAFAMLPSMLHDHPDGFYFDVDQRGLVRLNHGPFGRATLCAYHRAAAAMAASVGVIVDEVVLEPDLARDWVHALGELDAFVVAVHCDLVELERREVARGDRLIGQARGQFDIVHTLLHADFAVDTTAIDPEAAAQRIATAWRARTSCGALRTWVERPATMPEAT